MSASAIILWLVFVYILGLVLVISTLFTIRKKSRSALEKELNDVERAKNLLISPSILTELNKVKSLIQNTKYEYKYKEWKKQFDDIEHNQISKLTDMILNVETLIQANDFVEADYVIALVEMELLYIKVNVQTLIEEIQDITMSEEKNRSAIIRIKSTYRESVNNYNAHKNEFKGLDKTIDLQFENINKLFSAFERAMDNNEYDEVSKIICALDEMVNNINLVVNEAPTIILLSKTVIPKKINDIRNNYNKMVKNGYNLNYLNLDNNIIEAEKKINDIYDRLNVLNLEDSIFELKTIHEYFESLYSDFNKEKMAKKYYEDEISILKEKITRLSLFIKNIFNEIEELKEIYDLSKEELSSLDDIYKEMTKIKDDFKLSSDRTQLKNYAYSKISRDFELLGVRLSKLESKVESIYKGLGNLKEDEVRAREQIEEINSILKESKTSIKGVKLPVVPTRFNVQYKEVKESINNVVIELDKRPINIEVLNTRVDTARDLALKLYNTVSSITKSFELAEMSIVYGNRYRSTNKEVEIGLIKAEKEFYKGEYKKSLEIALNSLNIVEPGIHKKLKEAYKTN